MNPKEIEDQIKGLLGLNLGGAAPGTLPVAVGPGGPRPGIRTPGRGQSGPPRPGARGPPGPRHASPAPFGSRGGARPPGPFPRNSGPPGQVPRNSTPRGGAAGGPSTGRGPAPGSYPHGRQSKPRQESEDEEQNKRKFKNRKKSGSDIVTVEDDEAQNITEEAATPNPLETEIQFAQEAAQEAAADTQDEFKPSEAVLGFLAGKYLHPLAHKSSKFPRARWFCRLCEYHCDNLAKCREHYMDTRHSRLSRTKEVETTLYHLPRPNRQHLDCLNSLLATVEREQGLSTSDLVMRQEVSQSVHSLLQEHIQGCTVRLYGSSLSGFGLRSANVNLDLQITAEQKPHLALLKALQVLQDSPDYLEVVDEFTAKIPTIKFLTTTGLACELSLNNHHAYQTSSLLKDYWSLDPRMRTVGVAFRYWACLVRLDRQAEGTLPPHTFAILLVYFLQQQTKPLLPCIHEFLDPGNEDVYISPLESLAGWRTQNKMSPAELWIELFAFLSIGFKSVELVVSIRKSGMLTNEEKQWKTKRLAVEDPFSSKRNLCRSIQAGSVYDYITDCLKTGYLYFGTIQTSLGPIISRIMVTGSDDEPEDDVSLSDWTLESWLAKKGTTLTEKEAISATALVPRNMLNFSFDQTLLTNGTVPAIQCLVCGVEGHLPSSCPEEQLPPLAQLPHLTGPYQRLIDSVCEHVARDWEPQEPELRDRDYIMNDLNRYIKKFWPKAELTLFGSSSNGFAFRHSDLDISLTFRDVLTSANLDCIGLIEELSERIKRMVGMRNVVAITSAKVPIVKLFHQQCQIEADISLYNVLARENTRLLSLYADLDPRCRTLGYMVKLFAKICDIGDASRGSLSSYAYILMMIFYLQKVSPPVLPVLQEMYPPGTEKPENQVDGWNAWFYSDRRKVVSEWGGYNKNRQSLGELWIGFLNFYAGDWDDKRLVVSIRQSRPLTKFEKMWNSPCIAIEDPFELSHNLGAGISRKMNLYIKKAFINGRKLFGTPFKQNPPGYRTIQDYFFDPELLTDGAPPNDRGCRACGKIGHLVADCPRKKAADQRKKQAKERQRSLSEQPDVGKQDRQPGGEGQNRNRTRSEIPEAGNDRSGLVCTDIRFRDGEGAVQKEENTREKGDREKIRNLEKRRKRNGNGRLGKDENKLLFDLYKRVKAAKSETGGGKSDLNSSDDVNKSFEKAVKNVVGNGMNVESTRPRFVSKNVRKDEVDDEFDYNKVSTTVLNTGQIDYLNFDYNSVETKSVTTGVIDYLAPFTGRAMSVQSSFDEQLENLADYSASNENSTPESGGVSKQKNKKKARNERVSTIQDLKLTNKMLLEKCNEISKQFVSNLAENDSRSPSKLDQAEKMKLKNEKRKLKLKEKKKVKKDKKETGVRLSKSESECVQVDDDLLKMAENYAQVDLCREAEIKYFSS
eukprot:GFUD01000553.1.p1 GENE.GFUD01000553.1~~GFUD01000553.1.p1  ORF type:complete len:1415 (-),score=480.00 GFUD01000553.1:1102-5346(-)